MPGSPGYGLHQAHDSSLEAAKPEHHREGHSRAPNTIGGPSSLLIAEWRPEHPYLGCHRPVMRLTSVGSGDALSSSFAAAVPSAGRVDGQHGDRGGHGGGGGGAGDQEPA